VSNTKNEFDDDEDEEAWSSDEDEPPSDVDMGFLPDLETKINQSIEELGGEVFPKLTWSSPKVRFTQNRCVEGEKKGRN